MYTALVCLVLFDARGSECPSVLWLLTIAGALAALTLGVKYFPVILHRPQLIDAFCEDVLAVCAHCVCTSLVPPQSLQYACALHSALFLLEHRFLGKPRVPTTLAHTTAGLLLAAAYLCGPRTLELRPFILAVAYPHLVELLSKALAHVHKLSVLWLVDF